MVAKDKNDFLFQLHNELHRIGIDADEEIFADFEEHFKYSREEGLSEEETCNRLGDVKEIARSYIDIESSRINSIVAQAIENDRPHVSLKKPGRDVPADLSLVNHSKEYAKSAEELKKEDTAPPIREYTPEHITDETAPKVHVNTPKFSVNGDQNAAGTQPADSVSNSDNPSGAAQSSAVPKPPIREYTPEHIAQEPEPPKPNQRQQNQQPGGNSVNYGGVRINNVNNIGGSAAVNPGFSQTAGANSIPRQTNEHREHYSNSHKGTIPKQKAKDKGIKWKDFKQFKDMTPNVNIGKLILQICLDVFIYIWALPALGGAIGLFFRHIVIGVFTSGFGAFFGGSGFEQYHFLSRIFLGSGLVSGGVLLLCLWILMIKGFFHIIKAIVLAHFKAIYDL